MSTKDLSFATLMVLLFILNPRAFAGSGLYESLIENLTFSQKDIDAAREGVDEFNDSEPITGLTLSPFHLRVQPDESMAKEFCVSCHGELAHKATIKSRAFLNQHSRRVSCQTCHLEVPLNQQDKITYRWFDFSGSKKNLEQVPEGNIHKEFSLPNARIAPFIGEQTSVLFEDESLVSEILEQWETGDSDTRTKIKLRLHQALREEPNNCDQCHTGHDKDNLLDLAKLGANQAQMQQIRFNSIAHFFTSYTEDDQKVRLLDLLETEKSSR